MRRRRTGIFFLILGISLSALAVALNIGWILLNLREVALLIFGVIFFALIITGLIFNTIFLVREIRRNEQHDAFLNAVTHELKTPIASIKLYLETLKNREVSDEKRREFYDIMLADNERLLSTVEQVLHASRTGEKQRRMNVAEHDLADILNETVNIVRSRHNLVQDAVRLSVPDTRVRILGDRQDLQTAFANLIDNAVKYSGDRPPRVSVKLRERGKMAEIYIKDRGVGIPRSDLKRVFKRFYRVPSQAKTTVKGTGLGLPIVKSIIEKHGGTIVAKSNGIGKGSTFAAKLPSI